MGVQKDDGASGLRRGGTQPRDHANVIFFSPAAAFAYAGRDHDMAGALSAAIAEFDATNTSTQAERGKEVAGYIVIAELSRTEG